MNTAPYRSSDDLSEDCPRVLFVTSSAFNRVTGGGITFSNLFKGWPAGRIATIHNDIVPVTTDICSKYYRLSKKEIRKWGPRRELSAVNVGTGNKSNKSTAAGSSILYTLLYPLKRMIFGDGLPESAHLSRELEDWIETFKPDVVYSILGSNSMMILVDAIIKRFQIPLVIHLMDDWPSTIYRGGLLSPIQRRKMNVYLKHLLKIAKARMAICDDMRRAYEARYRLPFLAFHNAIDIDSVGISNDVDVTIKNGVRVLYIGSIFYNAQLQSLADCCRAVVNLRRRGVNIRLDIYSPGFLAEQYRNKLVIDNAITLSDTVTDDGNFFRELRGSDILLMPVNFDQDTINYIKYSMPTKIPAYLVSGTPILVYGPASIAQVRYALDEGWGHVVSRRGVQNVEQAFEELIDNHESRKRISRQAMKIARERHDSQVVRRQFQSTLMSAAHASH